MMTQAARVPRKSPRALLAWPALSALAVSLAVLACSPGLRAATPPAAGRVKTGLEVFLEKHLDLVTGKKVGLITNPTGADSGLRSTVDLLAGNPRIKLVALYGPEHGVRGDAQAGEYVQIGRAHV